MTARRRADVIAGLTAAAVVAPKAMAYATIGVRLLIAATRASARPASVPARVEQVSSRRR